MLPPLPLTNVPLSGNLNPHRRLWMTPYCVVVEIISTTLLTIRLTSRLSKLGGRPGFDDVLISIAWIFGVALTVTIIYGKIFTSEELSQWQQLTCSGTKYGGFETAMEDSPPTLW